jgi:hypothetical protein
MLPAQSPQLMKNRQMVWKIRCSWGVLVRAQFHFVYVDYSSEYGMKWIINRYLGNCNIASFGCSNMWWKQVRQFNGRLGQFLQCHTFPFVSIWRCCCHISFSSYIVHVKLWHRILWTGFQLSGAPELPCVIQIIYILSIAGVPDTRIAKEFGISTESIMLNNLQSIAHENRYQHLDSPQTAPSRYISNEPGIERLSSQYRVNVSYPKTQLAYCTLSRRIPPNMSWLSHEI